jgi:hypothetical protein
MIDTSKLSADLGHEFVLVCLTEHHWHIRDAETQVRLLNVWPGVNKYLECGAPKGHRAKLAGHDEIVRAARQVRREKLQSIKAKAEQQAQSNSPAKQEPVSDAELEEIFGPPPAERSWPPPAPPAQTERSIGPENPPHYTGERPGGNVVLGQRSPGDNVRSGPFVLSGRAIQQSQPPTQEIRATTEVYGTDQDKATDVQTLINESVTRITTQGKYKHRVEFFAAYTSRSQADEVEQLLLDLGRRSDYPAEFAVTTKPAEDPDKAIAELRHWLQIAMLQLNHNGDPVSRSFALNIKTVLESTAK